MRWPIILVILSILNSQIEEVTLYCDSKEENTLSKTCNIRMPENIRISKNYGRINYDIYGFNLGQKEKYLRLDDKFLMMNYKTSSYRQDIPAIVKHYSSNNQNVSELVFYFTDSQELNKRIPIKHYSHKQTYDFKEENILYGIDVIFSAEDLGAEGCLKLLYKKMKEFDKVFFKSSRDNSKFNFINEKYSTSFIGIDVENIFDYYQSWSWAKHILIDNQIVDILIIMYIATDAHYPINDPGDLVIRYINRGYLDFLEETTY